MTTRRAPGSLWLPEAAAAMAVHNVLVHRFPEQAAFLNTAYYDYLAGHGLVAESKG